MRCHQPGPALPAACAGCCGPGFGLEPEFCCTNGPELWDSPARGQHVFEGNVLGKKMKAGKCALGGLGQALSVSSVPASEQPRCPDPVNAAHSHTIHREPTRAHPVFSVPQQRLKRPPFQLQSTSGPGTPPLKLNLPPSSCFLYG